MILTTLFGSTLRGSKTEKSIILMWAKYIKSDQQNNKTS